jgi:signal transduction histidine kinase
VDRHQSVVEAVEQRLAISRRAVESNGGTLSVRDLPGRGCVFVIDLPRMPPPE